MRALRASLPREIMIADHTSEHGTAVTYVRGILMANAQANLREIGLYDDYERLVPRATLSALRSSVATSWVPVEHAVAHYQTCDKLPIKAEHYVTFGRRQAQRIRDTFLGFAIQRARSLGLTSLKASLARVGRLHDRLYQGGGCAVFELGPKEVIFEIAGFPFADSHSFQSGWLAYCEATAGLFARVVTMKLTRPRALHPHRLALQASWV